MSVKRCAAAIVAVGLMAGCGAHQQRLSGTVGPLGSSMAPSGKPGQVPKVQYDGFTYNANGDNSINSLTIDVPQWTDKSVTLDRHDYWDPSHTMLFRLDFSEPTGSAVGNWNTESADFANSHPGYKSLGIHTVTCPQGGIDCAQWQFTFPENGVTRQVIDRGIVVNNDFAFAIYVSGPQRQYSLTKQIFDHALASIRLSD